MGFFIFYFLINLQPGLVHHHLCNVTCGGCKASHFKMCSVPFSFITHGLGAPHTSQAQRKLFPVLLGASIPVTCYNGKKHTQLKT